MASASPSLSLSELFHAGYKVEREVDRAELVASNKEFIVKVMTAIQQLEEATRLVSELDMFSRNESVDEVSTADLRYMLLPALLGNLVPQLITDPDDRIASLERARVYFLDYLQRCRDYTITDEEIPEDISSDVARGHSKPKTMEQLTVERREKIARLRAKKETENKLRELDRVIESCESSRQPDEETTRERILTLLKLWVYKSTEGLSSLKQELDLLTQMKHVKRDLPVTAVTNPPPSSSRPPMKPFVITKEMIKDKVFGAGYPSLPTMTVEEFYELSYKNNPPPQQPQAAKTNEEDEEGEREETPLEEEQRLKKEREFDDFKDVNRRGWGNRKNQG